VNTGAALDQALAGLRPIIQESEVVILRGDMPAVTADHDLMVKLFENLIGNALKFCAGSGTWIEIARAAVADRLGLLRRGQRHRNRFVSTSIGSFIFSSACQFCDVHPGTGSA